MNGTLMLYLYVYGSWILRKNIKKKTPKKQKQKKTHGIFVIK